MTVATLGEVLSKALHGGYAVAGLVVLGWEDARAYVEAGEAEEAPVILQAGPGCRAHTPLPVLAAMFRNLAESATVPVVLHLDHSHELAECRKALDCGFTSVMFDGSRLPLNQNIEKTRQVAEMARQFGASCEGEIGFVGYSEGEPGAVTDAADSARFSAESGIDAMAISVGNVHLQSQKTAIINIDAIRAIEAVSQVPLVLHGGSGIDDATRRTLAATTRVCKFNIGTELRMAFGQSLRKTLADDPDVFDRIAILKSSEDAMRETARRIIRSLAKPA